MKNKKGLSAIVVTVILVALVLFAVVIVWAIVKDLIEPQFKITKEECRNETILSFEINKTISIPGYCVNNCIINLISSIENNTIKILPKICEKVEIENKVWDSVNLRWDLCNGNNISLEEWLLCDEELTKGLSIEWLDETCFCEEGEWNCKSGKLTKDCFGSTVNCCFIPLSGDRPEPDYKCQKYKYGNYIVEVLFLN